MCCLHMSDHSISPPAPCGASHSHMDTYHITSHTKMRKSIKKDMSWEMTAAAEREKPPSPPLSDAAFPCIAYEKSCLMFYLDGRFFVLFLSLYISENHFNYSSTREEEKKMNICSCCTCYRLLHEKIRPHHKTPTFRMEFGLVARRRRPKCSNLICGHRLTRQRQVRLIRLKEKDEVKTDRKCKARDDTGSDWEP